MAPRRTRRIRLAHARRDPARSLVARAQRKRLSLLGQRAERTRRRVTLRGPLELDHREQLRDLRARRPPSAAAARRAPPSARQSAPRHAPPTPHLQARPPYDPVRRVADPVVSVARKEWLDNTSPTGPHALSITRAHPHGDRADALRSPDRCRCRRLASVGLGASGADDEQYSRRRQTPAYA